MLAAPNRLLNSGQNNFLTRKYSGCNYFVLTFISDKQFFVLLKDVIKLKYKVRILWENHVASFVELLAMGTTI